MSSEAYNKMTKAELIELVNVLQGAKNTFKERSDRAEKNADDYRIDRDKIHNRNHNAKNIAGKYSEITDKERVRIDNNIELFQTMNNIINTSIRTLSDHSESIEVIQSGYNRIMDTLDDPITF